MAAVAEQTGVVSRSPAQLATLRFRRNKAGVAALIASVTLILLAFGAPVVCAVLGIDPDTTNKDLIGELGRPKGFFGGMSLDHPLGIEPFLGRDLLARLLYGARLSFTVAVVTTIFSISLGLLFGILSGYLRGKVDTAIGRVIDFLLAFPAFFMLLALSEPVVQRIEGIGIAHGNGARVLFLVVFMAMFGWMGMARLIRSQVLSLREADFVMAAEATGASRMRVVLKELLPNLWSPVIVVLSLSLPGYLTSESVLSFLGVGVQPPASTWGLLLADSLQYFTSIPSYFFMPAMMLIIVVLAFNLLGDALRDALDPKAGR